MLLKFRVPAIIVIIISINIVIMMTVVRARSVSGTVLPHDHISRLARRDKEPHSFLGVVRTPEGCQDQVPPEGSPLRHLCGLGRGEKPVKMWGRQSLWRKLERHD